MTPAWNPYEALSAEQRERLQAFERLLLGLNQKINLVSSGTAADFEERHVLHSLALAWRPFPAGSRVVDWGTGGGLPLIPLAICFPDVTFCGVDAVEKKLRAVDTMARRLSLNNVRTWHGRAEKWPGQANFAVSRAAASLTDLWRWSDRVLVPSEARPRDVGAWTSKLIALKGGDLREEIGGLEAAYPDVVVTYHPLRPLLGRAYFEEKYAVGVSGALSG